MRTTVLALCALALGGCAQSTTEAEGRDVSVMWTSGDDEPLEPAEGEPEPEPSEDAPSTADESVDPR